MFIKTDGWMVWYSRGRKKHSFMVIAVVDRLAYISEQGRGLSSEQQQVNIFAVRPITLRDIYGLEMFVNAAIYTYFHN